MLTTIKSAVVTGRSQIYNKEVYI